ncbi:hypothetical protein Tco_0817309 [Tanacetum coccineum]
MIIVPSVHPRPPERWGKHILLSRGSETPGMGISHAESVNLHAFRRSFHVQDFFFVSLHEILRGLSIPLLDVMYLHWILNDILVLGSQSVGLRVVKGFLLTRSKAGRDRLRKVSEPMLFDLDFQVTLRFLLNTPPSFRGANRRSLGEGDRFCLSLLKTLATGDGLRGTCAHAFFWALSGQLAFLIWSNVTLHGFLYFSQSVSSSRFCGPHFSPSVPPKDVGILLRFIVHECSWVKTWAQILYWIGLPGDLSVGFCIRAREIRQKPLALPWGRAPRLDSGVKGVDVLDRLRFPLLDFEVVGGDKQQCSSTKSLNKLNKHAYSFLK